MSVAHSVSLPAFCIFLVKNVWIRNFSRCVGLMYTSYRLLPYFLIQCFVPSNEVLQELHRRFMSPRNSWRHYNYTIKQTQSQFLGVGK